MSDKGEYLGELGLVLFGIVLAIITIPVICAVGVALLVGATGAVFYGIIILISCLIWSLLWAVYYI